MASREDRRDYALALFSFFAIAVVALLVVELVAQAIDRWVV